MTHDEMIAQVKNELLAQPAIVAEVMNISIESATAAWLKSCSDEYHRLVRHYNGMPKYWTPTFNDSAYLVALRQILAEQS